MFLKWLPSNPGSGWSTCRVLPELLGHGWRYVIQFRKEIPRITLPEGVNHALLVLVPKVQHSESLAQMRPISLCNVGCKVVTKILTNRLNDVMDGIIASNQSSFVSGRQITNHVLIYQEVLHSMRTKRTRKGVTS